MSQPILTLDDTLIIIHRLMENLLRAAKASDSPYNQQLLDDLLTPKQLDYVMISPNQADKIPVALRMGKLINTQVSVQESLTSKEHCVKLLDGTFTHWHKMAVVKIPTAVFCMRSEA